MSFNSVDALSLLSLNLCVASMSKSQILSCFDAISQTSLQRVLVSILAPHCTLQANKLLASNEVKSCRQLLKQYQNTASNPDGLNHRNQFTSLPRAVGGYILSFSTMEDRLYQSLTSRDIYYFSKDPSARYHFVVDTKLALALYNDQVQLHWFYNAQYFELKFVFKDSGLRNREEFEDKYYASIAQIIAKSPLLHTIKYELTHGAFLTSFKASTPQQLRSCSYTGHLLEWLYQIKQNGASRDDVFTSITTLILDPSSAPHIDRHPLRESSGFFQHVLPNLTTFKLTPRAYSNSIDDRRYKQNDAEWSVFKSSDMYKLRHLECDFFPAAHRDADLVYPCHPLRYLHRLQHLESLKLTLVLFAGCDRYYQRIVDAQPHGTSCLSMREISIEFIRRGEQAISNAHSVMDSVCAMIMRCCPNVTCYTLITNETFADKKNSALRLNHLMGCYDRLVSLETDTKTVFVGGSQMPALQRLVFRVGGAFGYALKENEFRRWCRWLRKSASERLRDPCMFPDDLKLFPHLREFTVIVDDNDWACDFNEIAKFFLEYISIQSQVPQLQRISIHHVSEMHAPVVRASHLSADICKLLVSLTCSDNFALESVALRPITLKQKEMEYLYFWFNTRIITSNTVQRRYGIKTDLVCLTNHVEED